MEEKGLQLYRPSEFAALAEQDLTPEEFALLAKYASVNGSLLSPEAATKFFELFLNGSSVQEIHRLNKAFPFGAILDAKIRYKWTAKRDTYADELQGRVLDKVRKAQLETTELMADLLVATKKRYGDKLKKYIQTGHDEDLDGVLNVESLQSLLKVSEGLLKITGQDRTTKSVHETKNTQNVNLSLSGSPLAGDLDPVDAAQILQIITDSKKRKNAIKS